MIKKAKPLGFGKGVLKNNGRGYVQIGGRCHGNPFCGVIADEIGKLYPGSNIQVELGILDPVIQRKPIRVGGKFIRIAEQAIKRRIPM